MLRVLEGEIGGAAEGKIGRRRSGEMELCSLNMDVIFRAEQKEGRDERASERGNGRGRADERGYGMRKE